MPARWRQTLGGALDAVVARGHRIESLRERRWRGPSRGRLPHPPVFLVGVPRCGSTVLYQLLADRFDVGYFANVHCARRGAPWLAERRHLPARKGPGGDYTSKHGQTRGPLGPSECGAYWYRFFRRRPQQVGPEEVPEPVKASLRASTYGLVATAQRPFLHKNLVNGLRLGALADTLPEALFVVVHRDEVEVGHSLLRARLDRGGSYDAWFSLEPNGWEDLVSRPPEEQVIDQQRLVMAAIDHDRSRVEGRRFLDVRYEDLCEDVHATLGAVAGFLHDHGHEVGPRHDVPPTLARRNDIRIDRKMYERMVAYAERHG